MISMAGILFLSGLSLAVAQDQPSAVKDSVNADKAAKPVFYDATKEETPKNSTSTYLLVIGAVVLVGAGGYFMMKKKKN